MKHYKKFIPVIANILSTTAIIPEIKHVTSTWNADELNIYWLSLSLSANILWIIYGFLMQDIGIIFLGSLFTSFYSLIITIKLTPQYKPKNN